ncbi:hypothetical protein [Lutimonas vermicola]|uniref:Uncharacterized protein n=1 Tax=Lutimonas vermicola TaxID=414288 RepID=A0ABU9KW73_9FLAO
MQKHIRYSKFNIRHSKFPWDYLPPVGDPDSGNDANKRCESTFDIQNSIFIILNSLGITSLRSVILIRETMTIKDAKAHSIFKIQYSSF